MARACKVKWLNRFLIGGPYLCLVKNKTEWDAAFAHLEATPDEFPSSDGRCRSLISKSGELSTIVLIQADDTRNSIEIAGLIVHEAVHVFQMYMRHLGEDSPGDEIEAYSIQIIAQRLMAQWCGQEHS